MQSMSDWLKQNKELCEALPPGQLAVDYDNRAGGADQIVMAESGDMTVAFMSTGWNRDDVDDATNPWSEFFVAARLSLPQALRIIEEILVETRRASTVNEREINVIAEAILNERSKP